eukprot:comp20947_c0_seq1/m.28002 comp20947_c0_seq1/g.28002  ORF comp20947_c0_seq1/g.28002 comp20947_c0_seq1/m.28002 type:complete len:307 (-) comp20947_c0_seq1:219-1139(-)
MPENSLLHMLPLLVLSWLQCVQGWQDGQSDLLAQNVQTHSKQIWAGASLLLGALTVPLVTHSIRRLAKTHPRTELVDGDCTQEALTVRPSDFLQPEESDAELRKRSKSAKKKVKREEKKKQVVEATGKVTVVGVPAPVAEVLPSPDNTKKTSEVVAAPEALVAPAVSVPTVTAGSRVTVANTGVGATRVEKKKPVAAVKKAKVSTPASAPIVSVTTRVAPVVIPTMQVARSAPKPASWGGVSQSVWAQPEEHRRHTLPNTAHFSYFTDGGFCGALIGVQKETTQVPEAAQPENQGTYSLFGTASIF